LVRTGREGAAAAGREGAGAGTGGGAGVDVAMGPESLTSLNSISSSDELSYAFISTDKPTVAFEPASCKTESTFGSLDLIPPVKPPDSSIDDEDLALSCLDALAEAPWELCMGAIVGVTVETSPDRSLNADSEGSCLVALAEPESEH